MIFHTDDTDDGLALVLDDEGIDYLMVGLEQLRDVDPGASVSAPALSTDGVGEFILRRA